MLAVRSAGLRRSTPPSMSPILDPLPCAGACDAAAPRAAEDSTAPPAGKVDVIEIVLALCVERAQTPKRFCGRKALRRAQTTIRSSAVSARSAAVVKPAVRAASSAAAVRREDEDLAAHDQLARRIGFEHVAVLAQPVANRESPQSTRFAGSRTLCTLRAALPGTDVTSGVFGSCNGACGICGKCTCGSCAAAEVAAPASTIAASRRIGQRFQPLCCAARSAAASSELPWMRSSIARCTAGARAPAAVRYSGACRKRSRLREDFDSPSRTARAREPLRAALERERAAILANLRNESHAIRTGASGFCVLAS
jgi:hypothetical protein